MPAHRETTAESSKIPLLMCKHLSHLGAGLFVTIVVFTAYANAATQKMCGAPTHTLKAQHVANTASLSCHFPGEASACMKSIPHKTNTIEPKTHHLHQFSQPSSQDLTNHNRCCKPSQCISIAEIHWRCGKLEACLQYSWRDAIDFTASHARCQQHVTKHPCVNTMLHQTP
jgi:hypothetical protein